MRDRVTWPRCHVHIQDFRKLTKLKSKNKVWSWRCYATGRYDPNHYYLDLDFKNRCNAYNPIIPRPRCAKFSSSESQSCWNPPGCSLINPTPSGKAGLTRPGLRPLKAQEAFSRLAECAAARVFTPVWRVETSPSQPEDGKGTRGKRIWEISERREEREFRESRGWSVALGNNWKSRTRKCAHATSGPPLVSNLLELLAHE